MIKPIDFPGRNSYFFPNPVERESEPVPMYTNGRITTFCFQLDRQAIKKLNQNQGKIFIQVVNHGHQVPLFLEIDNPVTIKVNAEEKI